MTPPPRIRPPYDADERTQLVAWLDMQRTVVQWKCEGVSEKDAHRSVLPASPAMTVAGVVSHLRWVEHCWFEVMLLGGAAEGPQFDDGPEDADMLVDDIPLDQLLGEYARQYARSNEITAAHSLDQAGRHPDFRAGSANLRWILLHMIEETARHAGHLDAIRELLDGEKGYY
ncbi:MULTISPECIES: DinB family protein [unclassified Streptomyces]|uniref:DinB family protein n=1 Tax=Streptomyces sp. NBC_00119 TaxID=2975659 RepID=A0AAU1UJ68_9ACTN|nr:MULTISPECIES: DinB family protein [unclassified Streptomyces]MCX4647594.1 DinB family protein [Streptomyces sp. NBC_01446]MCX5320169.1 DinB family protein [Streptomyces sp. NBC_00120]